MVFSSVAASNFRSITNSGDLDLGPTTVLVGRNNSGKSALLRAILLAHGGMGFDMHDIRHGATQCSVKLRLTPPYPRYLLQGAGAGDLHQQSELDLTHIANIDRDRGGAHLSVNSMLVWQRGQASTQVTVPTSRPAHLFVPILSRRKSSSYETALRQDLARTVNLDDRSLASRLSTLAGDHPEAVRYRELMNRILGLHVSTYVGEEGSVPGVPLSTSAGIDLERMGEGVRNVVTLASELADTSQTRLFLIEEPENDLHPQALGNLLEVIRESTSQHQFIVSTHSDEVLRELGSVPGARTYEVSSTEVDGLPTTKFEPIVDVFDRRRVLRDLGYRESVPLGWLVFEESTAERLVKDLLIPMFVPRLGALTTVAARGAGDLPAALAGLHHMILFAHLTEKTVSRAWVLADADGPGETAINKLRRDFASWPSTRFETTGAARIEDFYPPSFSPRVDAAFAAPNRYERMRLKGALAEALVTWAFDDPEAAERELSISARTLIEHLRRIEGEFAALVTRGL